MLRISSTLACAIGVLLVQAQSDPVAGDWPCFRHDPQLTGRSALQGGLSDAPSLAWSLDLGAPMVPRENVETADLDGDGVDEILVVGDDSLACLDRRGNVVWKTTDLPQVQVLDIRDFAGGGPRGIFAGTNNGLESTRWMISGATGKTTRLYTMRDVFGMEERVGRLLPDIPGDQICAWWSGDNADQPFGGVMHSEGYLYSFENGVETPVTRFSQALEGALYKPRHFFSDYDQDGETEMVAVSHQQAWFFDVARNALELQVEWPMIRTYWATLAMLPPKAGERPSLFSINPHIPGAERVDIVDGNAKVAWRFIAGGRVDQYQTEVKVSRGAPDPFVTLLDDGGLAVLVSVENEHGDGQTWLSVLDARDGARLHEAPGLTVLGYDDLDGDGVIELLINEGDFLRIVNWSGAGFVDRWRAADVEPVLVPLPSEGDVARNEGGNTPVQRAAAGSESFLLRYPDGVYACTLAPNGVVQGSLYLAPPVSATTDPPDETVHVTDNVAIVTKDGAEVFRYAPPRLRRYLAPPAVVADLDEERRVLAKNFAGNLVSFSTEGSDPRVLAARVFGDWSVCDLDGDGANEVVVGVTDENGAPACAVIDAAGTVERRIGLIDNATAMRIGPTGSLGPGRGRWLVIYYERGVGDRNGVVAYDGKSGDVLWLRDDFQTTAGSYGKDAKVKFVLHIPTAVYDYDGDGSDDLLAASENFYGIMSVSRNRDLTDIQVFSDYIPGHWQAYASPIAADLTGQGRPQVFHHRAFANTILTDLEGQPIWHWGLSRDQTASSWPGIADLDGNGTREIIQVRVDGLLRAFDGLPGEGTCPKCPPDAALTPMNHGGHVRWEQAFVPPISDLATADIDGDGREEVLFGSGDGNLYSLGEREGKPVVEWIYGAGSAVGAPILADLDGDDRLEILVPVADGHMRCLKVR